MIINGYPIAALGCSLMPPLEGWIDPPQLTRDSTNVPNVHGVDVSAFERGAARVLRVTLRMVCATLADRETNLALWSDITTGKIPITFDDRSNKHVRARLGPTTITAITEDSTFYIPDLVIRAQFIADDPVSYDNELTIVPFTTTPGAITPGTLPTGGIIYVTGALSATVSRTITYRSFNGIAYGTLTITPPTGESLGASDYLVINTIRQRIHKVTSAGVWSSVYHWKGNTAWNTMIVDPADSDRLRGGLPTYEISSGAATFVYRAAHKL